MGERLIRLSDPARAEKLFVGWPEMLIWSALEGGMGCIWAVSEQPKAALCENGDFLFLAGASDEPETGMLLECWRREKGRFEILTPRDAACGALIERIFGPDAKAGERCAFQKGGEKFDDGKTWRPRCFAPGCRPPACADRPGQGNPHFSPFESRPGSCQ